MAVVVEYREVLTRLMWVKVMFGEQIKVCVTAFGPGNERSEEEREKFLE